MEGNDMKRNKRFWLFVINSILLVSLIITADLFAGNQDQDDRKQEKTAQINAHYEGGYKDPYTGMQFVIVKGGCYQMGCGRWTGDCDEDEEPVHEVCLDDFLVGKYEVTQGQWRKVMGNNPSGFKQGDNYPVEKVSRHDVQEFISRLNQKHKQPGRFRLPTEAEWEYMCRGGGKKVNYGTHSGSISKDLANYGGIEGNSGKDQWSNTSPVGSFPPNTLGIYDASGNVNEWVADTYSIWAYKSHSRKNPIFEKSEGHYVLRGGSWNGSAVSARCSNRHTIRPTHRYNDLGFRLVKTVPALSTEGADIKSTPDKMLEKIHWFGQSGVKIETGDKIIYIDPLIAEKTEDADIILITHPHSDHFDLRSIEKVAKKETVFIATQDCEERIKSKFNAQVITLKPGMSKDINGILIEAVPAYNTPHPKINNWVGYILTIDGVRIYHAGDTERIPEMKEFTCDIAMLPLGQTYTMKSVEEAAEAAQDVKAKIAIPIHFGIYEGTKEDADKFAELLKGNIQVVIKEKR